MVPNFFTCVSMGNLGMPVSICSPVRVYRVIIKEYGFWLVCVCVGLSYLPICPNKHFSEPKIVNIFYLSV